MSQRPDGVFRCDRCDADVGNAGIDRCAIVSDLDPDAPGTIRTLHLCNGCRGRVLTARALAAYLKDRKARTSRKARRPAPGGAP